MKTRIVYPQMWLDEKFAQCNVATKLLFCYLINNLQLGLSPYLHITDRQIMFDTGLNTNQLATGKEELSNLGWVYFTENWCFHNHKAAYIDYDGRDRVIESKEQEIANVPNKVKEVFKGLVTGYKPVLNPKSEIIKQKEGGVGETKPKHLTQLQELQEDINFLQSLADKYNTPLSFVKSKLDDLESWIGEKPSRATGRNLKLTLGVWVKKDAIQERKDYARANKPKIAIVSAE